MSYEQFWEQDVELVKSYREAWKLRQEQKNHELWLQGLYIYEALCDASPVFRDFAKRGTKPAPYRDKPYELFDRTKEKKAQSKEERSDNKAKTVMEMFMVNINRKFEQKGGEENGG